MACCGEKRKQFYKDENGQMIPIGSQPQAPVDFEYIGRSGLTVIGNKTRQRYCFERPGAIVTIDPADWLGMLLVPSLREVRNLTNDTG